MANGKETYIHGFPFWWDAPGRNGTGCAGIFALWQGSNVSSGTPQLRPKCCCLPVTCHQAGCRRASTKHSPEPLNLCQTPVKPVLHFSDPTISCFYWLNSASAALSAPTLGIPSNEILCTLRGLVSAPPDLTEDTFVDKRKHSSFLREHNRPFCQLYTYNESIPQTRVAPEDCSHCLLYTQSMLSSHVMAAMSGC